jgi:YfiH family protein
LAAFFPFVFDGSPVIETARSEPAPRCGISSREAGDLKLDNEELRHEFFRSLGIEPERVKGLKQVHSQAVSVAPCFAGEGDGMVSFSGDPVLAVTVADCLPVFLLDVDTGAFAALHSGWKGTGIVLNALKLMGDTVDSANIAAVLGPCIRSCCYNVDEGRAKGYRDRFGEDAVRYDGGLWYLDMQAANIALLEGAGVRHIAVCRDCTFTDDRLGSFRRERENYTHMAAFTGIF